MNLCILNKIIHLFVARCPVVKVFSEMTDVARSAPIISCIDFITFFTSTINFYFFLCRLFSFNENIINEILTLLNLLIDVMGLYLLSKQLFDVEDKFTL